ncbi:ABC transporter ATP-binding protein [Streptomyces sp. SP18CS02]|uniref:ABC transporter ATP-binding protein n=1 Tax=Streptomyces sp. SP18CS02 TaxID=3002531 RepID=UPI002E7762F1|nr:ABC transporter ATP-binding protein [Streptomyces sp. SP18CS02]MEE1756437.1 ABC transporter ATP-binding protein [Streptomyces sp. SP18CS02]
MKRLFTRPKPVEPAVSTSEHDLFGGPLRYDMGWSTHEYARLELTLLSALRSVPQMVSGTLRLALRADRRAMVTVAVTEIGQGITAALGLIVLNTVLQALLGAGSTAERLHEALPALVAGGAIAVAGAVLASLSTASAGRLEPKVERAANERFLEASAGVELEAIEDGEFRRLIDIAQFGAASARRMVGVCVAAVNGIISLIAAGGVLTILHPALLPMLLLIAAPRGWGAMRVAQRRYVSTMQWVEHIRAGRLLGNLLTSRTAAQEVRVHGVGGFFLGHYRTMAESAEEEQSRLAKDKAATEFLAAGLSGVAAVATYVALGALILAGHMDLAVAGTAVIAVRSGSAGLGGLVMNLNALHEESLYVRDLERFVDEAGRRAIPVGGLPVAPDTGAITFEKVSYGYPDREGQAVADVSLTVPVGQVTALVGENGAGKSTFIKMLAGLLLPDSGRILWDGVDLREADRQQVFAQVGLLTQDFERWPMTAGTNIRISDTARPADEAAMEAAAGYAGADRMIAELPHGMNTLLARMFRGASELSGGQWQKLGLARARYRDARVLIVDEPTSALDPAAEIAAFEKIRALAGPERAVVLVTHRMAAVQHADRIHVLHEGRLAEEGTHDELMARGGRYASMYRAQASQYRLEPAHRTAPVVPGQLRPAATASHTGTRRAAAPAGPGPGGAAGSGTASEAGEGDAGPTAGA